MLNGIKLLPSKSGIVSDVDESQVRPVASSTRVPFPDQTLTIQPANQS